MKTTLAVVPAVLGRPVAVVGHSPVECHIYISLLSIRPSKLLSVIWCVVNHLTTVGHNGPIQSSCKQSKEAQDSAYMVSIEKALWGMWIKVTFIHLKMYFFLLHYWKNWYGKALNGVVKVECWNYEHNCADYLFMGTPYRSKAFVLTWVYKANDCNCYSPLSSLDYSPWTRLSVL